MGVICMHISVSLLLVLLCLSLTDSKPQRLLLLLLDGVRHDYLDYEGLGQDGFRRVLREGVRAEYLQPDFPTKSYPNYYSIMTGLHSESHGMVGNFMYDTEREEAFLIGTNPEQAHAHWWNGGDPLWITAARQRKTSYFYHWLGCEVEIRGLRPTYCRNYTKVPSLEDNMAALEDGLQRLENNADIVGVYFEMTDKYGHFNGPFGDRVKIALQEIDRQIAYTLSEFDRRGLSDVNLILFSDHGMTEMAPNRTIDLSKKIGKDVHIYLEGGPILFIWPKQGKLDIVYRSLVHHHPHMTVYLKDNIPERWHFKKGRLTPPILAVADLGWYILTPRSPHYPSSKNMEPLVGDHGYDNFQKDMQGVLAAVGPAFRKNVVTPPIRVVDLYQMMSAILEVTPSPNNGSWGNVQGMLKMTFSSSSCPPSSNICHIYICICLLLLRLLYIDMS